VKRLFTFASLKSKLIAYLLVIFIMVIGIVLVGNFYGTAFFREYNQLYMQYESLNSFFENINNATEYMRNYLFTRDETEIERYRQSKDIALESLRFLESSVTDEDIIWEFTKLSKMFETYENAVEAALLRTPSNSTAFSNADRENIDRLNHLINRLAVYYFNNIIVNMNRRQDILQNIYDSIRIITASILLAIILIGGTFSIILLRSITRPINSLVKSVQNFKEGDYSNRIIKGGGSEIVILINAFNDMVLSLDLYVKELNEKASLQQLLLEQENENLRIRGILRETEYKALQSQMNPHFFFNTLSIISKMAYIENAKQTSSLMESTMQLLRYSVDNSGKVSDIESEIECAKNYFYIQKMRFGDRLKLELIADQKIPNIKMPSLIIQPMIENAIIHGVGDMVCDGWVRLTVKSEENQIIICIEDNGSGIKGEIIENIMFSEDIGNDGHLGIGIANVKKRLEIFFGEKNLFFVESSLGCGTVVTIKLPFIRNSGSWDDV